MSHWEAFPDYTWSQVATPEVDYSAHEFLGKRRNNDTQTFLWRDVTLIPFNTLLDIVIIESQNFVASSILDTEFANITAVKNRVQQSFDTDFPWYIVNVIENNGSSYFSLTWSNITFPSSFFQLGVYDEVVGDRIIWMPITNITITIGDEFEQTEIIKLSEKIFSPSIDKVFYKWIWTQTLAWEYEWWSRPEGNGSWSSLQPFTPWDRSYTFSFNTNWISWGNSWATLSYTNLSQIVANINSWLLTAWSVFTLIAIWEDIILVWDNNWTPLLSSSQYFIDNLFQGITLEIYSTVASRIIQSQSNLQMQLNITYPFWESMFYWKISERLQLPVPIIRLQKPKSITQVQTFNQNISWVQYNLHWYPEVIVQDIPEGLLSQWVRLAFGYYRLSKWWRKRSRHKKYARPSHWVWWVTETWQSRWWWHFINIYQPDWTINLQPLAFNRPSHWAVTSNTQIIPFWQWLHNRFTDVDVKYRDTAWVINSLTIFWPLRARKRQQWKTLWQPAPSKNYAYTSHYTPYRIVCRYEYQVSPWKWISWPISDKVCIVYRRHPFLVSDSDSLTLWKQSCTLNNRWNKSQLIAYIEKN